MASWFITLNILLLISTPFLQARFRINLKRRYPMSTKPFVPPPLPMDDNSYHASDGDDSLIESSLITTTARPKNRASEEQVQQFTRLIYDRLNLKEPPNVTVHAQDGTGIPPSIVKQLEQHHMHHKEEDNLSSQQKYRDENQPTTERAILPGDFIPNHACQRQLAIKFNLNKETATNIDCFRFTKSPMESKSLPTNQIITQLRIYVKKNYFHFNNELKHITPDMFRIYQVFRPTSNDTSPHPFRSLTGTIHLSISQVKQLNDKWFELTIDPDHEQISIEQIYKQFIMPLYGLAINHELQPSSSSSSPLRSSYYRRYYTKKSFDGFFGSNENEDDGNDSTQQLPYMLVEYGEIVPGSGNRATRGIRKARPEATCDPKSPCCRRSLTIDLDQGNNALNFVIYPRKIDIGECIGVCGTSGSSLKFIDVKNAQQNNEQNAAHNLLLLHHNGFHHYKNTTTTHERKADQQSSHCCSYSRTGGLELMYTTTNGGPIIRKYIPGIIVEECRCGLPATIQ
ncbi:hypothetical protein I4U23_024825 [Adineta vaga]|nr:hypothetical protein I4U23_024825 [Adineta vaga]